MALVAVMLSESCAPAIHVRPRIDPVLYPEPRQNAITFWGHACAYIDVGGVGIVTDPVFAGSYGLVHRRQIPAPPSEAYDRAQVVLLSHAHHDHLDFGTLARFSPRTAVLCPAPAARYLKERGIRARVMRPGSEYRFAGGTITAVAAHHPGGRLSMKARSDGRALGYVIRTDSVRIFYSGDTEYFPELAAIGLKYAPDIVLLNVNRHLHSKDALHAVKDLRAPLVVPMHFGAYSGSNARLGRKWRAELVRALGPIVAPLEVGAALPIPHLKPQNMAVQGDTASCFAR